MKIRWTENSIRLRISPSELDALLDNQIVRESVHLASGGWSTRILPGCASTDCGLVDGDLLVYLSSVDVHALAEPTSEGVYFKFDTSVGSEVLVYIEKDFPCAHPRPSKVPEAAVSETFAPTQSYLSRQGTEASSLT